MVEKKSIKERLYNGEPVFGMFYKLASPIAVEIMGWAGLDFIVIDCEHSAMGYESVENTVRFADSVGMSTVVRIPCAAEEHIFHALDSGAEGVQIPNMTSVEEFRENARVCKYFPDGVRGLSRGTRNAMFGLWNDAEKPYVQAANEKSLVVVHIENKEMADAIEEICRIPQIDVVFVGPADMSQSLGIPGKSRDPKVVEVANKVLDAARKYGKIGGINITNPADIDMFLEHGARYIMCGADTGIFAKGMKAAMAQYAPYRK